MLLCHSRSTICSYYYSNIVRGNCFKRSRFVSLYNGISRKIASSNIRGNSSKHENLESMKPIYEINKFTDPTYFDEIIENSLKRKYKPNIKKLKNIQSQINSASGSDNNKLMKDLQNELLKLPNRTCPKSKNLTEPEVIGDFGTMRNICDALPLEKLSHHGVDMGSPTFTGKRSYYLRGSMARLEHNLIRYAVSELTKEGFELMSVPDLITEDILDCCGVPVIADGRSMVYHLDAAATGAGTERVCLSGTAEMAIGGWLRGRSFHEAELPLKLCAVSRCYRAEAKGAKDEIGIFRVHNFTKVEMFGVTANETGLESDALYQQLVALQRRLLENMGLHGKVVLMPPAELGKPAYSKTDLEAWLPGRRQYGELTSASNCTSYQAARLGATYTNARGEQKLVHTVNGTAIAVPRCIIALCETHQEEGGRKAIRLPKMLNIPTGLNHRRSNEITTVENEQRCKTHVITDVQPHATDNENLETTEQQELVGKCQEMYSDVLVEKVMVYQEQCKRKSLSDVKYSNM